MEAKELNASELRLGNLLYWDVPKKKGVPHEVTSIRRGSRITTRPISLGECIADYSPIPLTEEWLERMPVFQHSVCDGYKMYECMVNGVLVFKGDKNGYCEIVVDYPEHLRFRYLHEFQNWYRFNKGEELTIKTI